MGNMLSNLIPIYNLDDTILDEITKLEQNIINLNIMLEQLNEKSEIITNKIDNIEYRTDQLIPKQESELMKKNKYISSKLEWDNYDIRLTNESSTI